MNAFIVLSLVVLMLSRISAFQSPLKRSFGTSRAMSMITSKFISNLRACVVCAIVERLQCSASQRIVSQYAALRCIALLVALNHSAYSLHRVHCVALHHAALLRRIALYCSELQCTVSQCIVSQHAALDFIALLANDNLKFVA
jgi:hypothetical protein